MAESVWERGVKEALRQSEPATRHAIPLARINTFLIECGIPARDVFRVEIERRVVRLHRYDRLDDGEHYLGPDGIATSIETIPVYPVSPLMAEPPVAGDGA